MGNARDVRYHVPTGVVPVGPQPLTSFARPPDPAARGAGPSDGSGLGTTGITMSQPSLITTCRNTIRFDCLQDIACFLRWRENVPT